MELSTGIPLTHIQHWQLYAIIAVISVVAIALLIYKFRHDIRLLKQQINRQENELEHQKNMLQNYMNNLPVLTYIKDLEGRFIAVNNSWSERARRSPESVMGKTDFDLYPEKLASTFHESDDEVLQRNEVIIRENQSVADGGKHHFLTQKFPLHDKDGNIFAVGTICTDITTIKQLNAELTQSRKEAEAVNQENSAFLIQIRDEISTTMQSIEGLTQLCLQTSVDPEQRNYLEKIHDTSHSLTDIIDDILQEQKKNHDQGAREQE